MVFVTAARFLGFLCSSLADAATLRMPLVQPTLLLHLLRTLRASDAYVTKRTPLQYPYMVCLLMSPRCHIGLINRMAHTETGCLTALATLTASACAASSNLSDSSCPALTVGTSANSFILLRSVVTWANGVMTAVSNNWH